MAKLIDREPNYEGEKKVWNIFGDKLPQDWVIYNNRSINGREYDFCVIAPEIGLFIIEVKGWAPLSVLTVVDPKTIILKGRERPDDSPLSQARGYRFDMLNKINKELDMNPLVMSLVCYPFISKEQYLEKGLNVVSEENETIFSEDLNDSGSLYNKFLRRYNIDKGARHENLSLKKIALIRHHFEPNYDLKKDEEILNPGYSRLRIYINELDSNDIKILMDEYFSGIKEIVFVPSSKSMNIILDNLNLKFKNRNIYPDKGNLYIGKKIDFIKVEGFHFNIFNFEIEVIPEVINYFNKNVLIEEGECNSTIRDGLKQISSISAFNYQQYEIEHAPYDKNLLITAGAGTGKTYSMVSRIAYLCNKKIDAIVDVISDIAMITFTNDAANNMKTRIKNMFMNYFILTSNEKYMHLIENMSQMQISTIHKFCISLLQKDCMRMGLGYDCQISSETYNRRELYHHYLNQYLSEKNEENPNFSKQLNLPSYKLEELLLEFSNKLYDRNVDIKNLSLSAFGEPVDILSCFNELVEKVMIKAENDYAELLKESNFIGLRECMIQINDLVTNNKLMKQGLKYKYLFVDEFQDTDDTQIETIIGLQHLFGKQCNLFIVGDLKQSIYRFRGASISAFEKAVAFDGKNYWEFYSLNRNYRTDSRLLNKFHFIFTQMGVKGVLPYDEFNDRLGSQITKQYSEEQLIYKVETHYREKEIFFDDLFKEIDNQVKLLKDLSEKEKLSKEEKTIAILVRYNRQVKEIVNEAMKRGLSIKTFDGGDLYRLPSSRDLYKLVMAITHPTNEIYLTNLIMSNYVSVNLKMFGLAGKSKEDKRLELIRILDEYFMLYMGKTWNRLVMDFESRPVLVVLRDIYETLKPWMRFIDVEDQKSYRRNYECLIEKIINKYIKEYLTINKVLKFLKINITTYQEEASRNIDDSSDSIQIICTTIHKSKGLEFGTVVVPFTNEDIARINIGDLDVNYIDGKVYYRISLDQKVARCNIGFDEELETREKILEESRIFYVALTRTIRNFVWVKDLDKEIEHCWGNYMEVSE